MVYIVRLTTETLIQIYQDLHHLRALKFTKVPRFLDSFCHLEAYEDQTNG